VARQTSALNSFATRLGRHTAVYGAGMIAGLVGGLISIAVLTRYLTREEFGHLALLLLFAAALTILYNLPTLQGSFAWVFGATGDDDVVDDVQERTGENSRRALTTALVITAGTAAIGTAIIALSSSFFARLVTGQDTAHRLVLLAAVSGGLGSIWRLMANVPRYERRPVTFVTLSILRPAFVLGLSIPLVAAGHGVEGALVGTAGGTLAALLVAFALTARNYAFSVSWDDAREIATGGIWFAPLVLGLWVIQNLDLYLISLYMPDDDVALYRVGSRVAALMSYFVSAFLVAWTPLSHTALGRAVEEEVGPTGVAAAIATYYVAVTAWILLGMAMFADLLVRIAPQSYGDAAPLIPLIGLSFVAYGAFQLVQRGSHFPGKREMYRRVSVGAGFGFALISLVLLPALGAYGPPVAQIIAFTAVTLVFLAISQRGAAPIPFEWRRIGALVALTAVLIASATVAANRFPDAAVWIELGVVLAYPALAVLVGGIPRAHLPRLFRLLARPTGEHAHPSRRKLMRRVRALEEEDREVLERVARRRTLWSEREDPEWVLARAVGALRALGGIGRPTDADSDLGRFLFLPAPVADRDRAARRLVEEGVPAIEIDALESLVARIRGKRPRRRAAPSGRLRGAPAPAGQVIHAKALSADRPGPLEHEFLFSRIAPIPYYIREATTHPDTLLVSFSGFRRPDLPPAYSNVRLLGDVGCHVLFTRAYEFYLGQNRTFTGRDAAVALIEQVQRNYDIDRDKLIALGASQGAMAALTAGGFAGVRHIIAAAPALYVADAIPRASDNAELREHLIRFLAGGTDQDSIDYLNALVGNRIQALDKPTDIHIFCSRHDELYDHHMPDLFRLCEENPMIELHVTEGGYTTHREVEEAFKPWFKDTFQRILASEDHPSRVVA
jgi:O-antigen/teichoic acid export membrane protein/predicted esterase